MRFIEKWVPETNKINGGQFSSVDSVLPFGNEETVVCIFSSEQSIYFGKCLCFRKLGQPSNCLQSYQL